MIPILAQIPGWMISLLAILFLVVCLALVLIVLIQRPQGGGLSGAFGAGGGAGQTAFGTKTGDVLTMVTIGIFLVFLVVACVLNFWVRPPEAPAAAQQQVITPEAAQTVEATTLELEEMSPEEGGSDQDGAGSADTDTDGDEPVDTGEPGVEAPASNPESPADDPTGGAP